MTGIKVLNNLLLSLIIVFGNNLVIDPSDISSTFQNKNSKNFCHFEINNHSCNDFGFTMAIPNNVWYGSGNVGISYVGENDKVLLNNNVDAITKEASIGKITDIKFQCPDNNYYNFSFNNFNASLDLSNFATNPSFKNNELVFTLKDGVTGDQNLGGFSVVADQQDSTVFNLVTKCGQNGGVWSLDTVFLNAGAL